MAWAASSIWRKRRWNRRERTRTESKKRGRLEIHLDWSAERPSLGTIMRWQKVDLENCYVGGPLNAPQAIIGVFLVKLSEHPL